MAKSSLTYKGRIVIPKQIRNDLNLKEGDTLAVEVINSRIVLKPIRTRKRVRASEVAGILKTDKKFTLEEIDEAVETAMREHFLKEGY